MPSTIDAKTGAAEITFGPQIANRQWPLGLGWLFQFARRKPLGFAGLMVLVIVGGAAAFAPLVTPYHYATTNFGARLEGPSLAHIFGTDNLGRDLFTRVVYGARVSLGISFAAVILAKSIATTIGIVTGYYGGWVDKIGQRFVDMWIALPRLIIIITMIGLMGASATTLIILVGLANAPTSIRLIRSTVVSVREEAYMEAARALGASNTRIMVRHLLPNVFHIVMFSATVTLGAVILIVASLGFLGYGVPPPQPDLGAMLSGAGLTYMRQNPWMAFWPGIIITAVVFAFNVLGDALRDVLDPRLRGSR
ncbi:MAG: ABC transporter permease [Chloroflexi bacterium]|nr:ABC transporter permease [Chloroflexota bacterium]